MANKHNVNVDSFVKNPITLTINNDNEKTEQYSRARNVDLIVEKLEAGLNTKPESRPFLCKAAWKLSESRVWLNYEKAISGKNPMGLFIWLCKKDGV